MPRIRYSLELLDPLDAPLSRRQLDVGRYRIGRGAHCEVRIEVGGVSREHTEIEVMESGGAVVRDLRSTNGTRVDGRPVERVALDGDFVLDLGAVRLRLVEHDDTLSQLAYETGLPAPAGTAESGSHEPETGTSHRSLAGTLRDALWAALPDARRTLPEALTRVLNAWLAPLEARGLRLRDAQGRVVAAAGDQGIAFAEVTAGEHWRLEADAATAASPPLVELAVWLLAWLPATAGRGEARAEPNCAFPGLETAHLGLRRQMQALKRVAQSRVSVLLLGETGVGKDVFARWLHACSPRAEGPFVAINCAALPRDLLEAELFGIEKGAATGVEARPGVFERAHGGTLFLDELGDMPPETQVRLLRALEEGRIHRVGGKRLVEVDVRLIGATHCDLAQAIAEKRFRLDLYHRLAGFEVSIPPLRERREDIAPLAIHFFTRALAENGLVSPGITAAALFALQQWDWPGNVRELRQAVDSATATLQAGEALDRQHLPPRLASQALSGAHPTVQAGGGAMTLAEAVARAERQAIEAALEVAAGVPEQAWQRLGIGKTTFYKKLKEHGFARAGDLGD
jgi:DNA-binding NtrC family response regulator